MFNYFDNSKAKKAYSAFQNSQKKDQITTDILFDKKIKSSNEVGVDQRDFAFFGNVNISVFGYLKTMSEEDGVDFADYDMAIGSPISRPIGEKLKKISFNLDFVDIKKIESDYKNLQELKQNNEAHIFMIGEKFLGKFYIENIKREVKQCLPDGTIINMSATMTLIEHKEIKLTEIKKTEAPKKKRVLKNKIEGVAKANIIFFVKQKELNALPDYKKRVNGSFF